MTTLTTIRLDVRGAEALLNNPEATREDLQRAFRTVNGYIRRVEYFPDHVAAAAIRRAEGNEASLFDRMQAVIQRFEQEHKIRGSRLPKAETCGKATGYSLIASVPTGLAYVHGTSIASAATAAFVGIASSAKAVAGAILPKGLPVSTYGGYGYGYGYSYATAAATSTFLPTVGTGLAVAAGALLAAKVIQRLTAQPAQQNPQQAAE